MLFHYAVPRVPTANEQPASLYLCYAGRGAGFRDFLRLPPAKENPSNRRTLPASQYFTQGRSFEVGRVGTVAGIMPAFSLTSGRISMAAVVRAFFGYLFLSITNCPTAIVTIGLMHWGVSAIKTTHPLLGAMVAGTPLTLLKKGEWQLEVIKGMRIDREDVMAAARTKGVNSIHEVAYAILERNGTINILENEQ
jgi:hypothetical protein